MCFEKCTSIIFNARELKCTSVKESMKYRFENDKLQSLFMGVKHIESHQSGKENCCQIIAWATQLKHRFEKDNLQSLFIGATRTYCRLTKIVREQFLCFTENMAQRIPLFKIQCSTCIDVRLKSPLKYRVARAISKVHSWLRRVLPAKENCSQG